MADKNEWKIQNPKDVFIVYSSEDRAFVQKEVIKGLKNYGISCLDHEKDFIPGSPVVENIHKAVLHTRKTVVVLTPNSLQSSWVQFEHLLALEKSAHTKKVALCYLLCDVKKEEISKFSVLSNTMVVEVDCNKDDWIEKLVKLVTAEQSMESVLPAGNLAVGQVWSHWNGFHKVVLPELKLKIEGSEFYKSNPRCMPLKYFELIPLSCECHDNLNQADKCIRIAGSILIRENPRTYKVTVYEIIGENGNPYHFVSGYPNVLKVIPNLEKDKQWLSTSQETSHSLSPVDRHLQVWRFYYTMNQLLNHPMNRPCNNMVRLLVYDDKDKNHSLHNLLLQEIKEDLLKTSNQHCGKNSIVKHKATPQGSSPCTPDKLKTVCIVTNDQSRTEMETQLELQTFLTKAGFIVIDCVKPGKSQMKVLSYCLSAAQWAVFLFSQDTLKEEKSHMYMYNVALNENVAKNQLHVIPLLIDVPDGIIPEDFAWVTYIKKENSYKERLLATLRYENKAVDCSIPVMDVTTGLAWAYVLNYLAIYVPEYVKLMDKELGQYTDNPMKIYLLIPASCDTSKQIDPPTDSDKIKFLVHLATKETHVSGTLRIYELNLYTVNEAPGKRGLNSEVAESNPNVNMTGYMGPLNVDTCGDLTDRSICFTMPAAWPVLELSISPSAQSTLILTILPASQPAIPDTPVAVQMVTPIGCLWEMAKHGPLSGFRPETLHDEAWKFYKLTTRILEESVKAVEMKLAERVELLYYDDERCSPADAIIGALTH